MEEFKTGQKFNTLHLEGGRVYTVGLITRHLWPTCVSSITCIMEAGEMAGVAWFVVEFEDDVIPPVKVNGKYVVEIS